MIHGWRGKRLRVDLSSEEIVKEELSLDFLKRWLGGRGINIKALEDKTADPFSPQNPICFSVGPLCGTLAPCSGMTYISSRSPLLDPPTLATVTMGGHWGAELKYAGYDQLIIEGKAKRPLYLWINDDEVKLRDATHLWGKDTLNTALAIQEELKDRAVQVVCIGPGGERLVRFASIVSLFWEGERLGLGAVMGAKKLKAIAIKGSKPLNIKEPKGFIQTCQKVKDKLKGPLLQKLSEEGTLFLLKEANLNGLGAFRNHSGYAPGLEDEFNNIMKYFSLRESCFSCPIGCSRHVYLKAFSTHFGGVFIEKLLSLGPRIGTYRWDHVLRMIQMCNLYGLDAISTGGVISWAMECEDTELHWGNVEATLKTIDMIIKREGFGELLGEGVKRASESLGQVDKALHVKGLEEPCFDPRIATGSALSFAVSTCDWDSLKSLCLELPSLVKQYPQILEEALGDLNFNSTLEYKPKLMKFSEDRKCASDLVGICSFPIRFYSLKVTDIAELVEDATGIDIDEKSLLGASERIIDLERICAVRDGLDKSQDTHPDHFFKERISEGPYKGVKLDQRKWEQMLSEYYKCRGWQGGVPKLKLKLK
jgi:aldehyde:ferredoxin oxidoreductase